MDRQEWKVLNAYRNRLMARLEYAFGDGYIDEEQYSTLYDEVTAATGFGQLRRVLAKLRVAKGTTRRVRIPRWQLDRDRRRANRERRWWRPERFWGIGIVVAVVIGAGTLALIVALTDWVTGTK
ncbi:MAG TPA: DUF1707 domain-containing protein [Candidatus Stackebrandtia excrementipullorum]|nr:DUF1707 domain-containing protein [Candidatus Stackebrandtia excrementipullorum]